MQNFNLLQQLLEDQYTRIGSSKIKIENGIMIPNQFPDKVGWFGCFNLKQLTSLENCPQEVINSFNCDNTNITSLQYSPKKVEFYHCQDTKITSLDYAPLKCGEIDCRNNILHLKGIGKSYLKECQKLFLPDTIKLNILGLCRIKKLEKIYIFNKVNRTESGDLYEAIEIVKKYLNTDGSDCQEELIQNGFNDYAKF